MKITIETDGQCVGTKVKVGGVDMRVGASALWLGFDAMKSSKWYVRRAVTDDNGAIQRDDRGDCKTETVSLTQHISELRNGKYAPLQATS